MEVVVQATPNPNAYKFVVDVELKSEGKTTATSKEECLTVPLAYALFELNGVEQLHFFENTLTVTKSSFVPWEDLEVEVRNVLLEKAGHHDPHFNLASEKARPELTGELKKIDDIIEEAIRPYLQGDGGDIEVVALEDHILTVRYEGACGTCPSAIGGTLMAIQDMLRDEYDPEIEVVTV